ncbi:MAG: 50S ribosome-binding GTPase [Saprospiraceae bacterium]|nr:50S ribosome-binding GTPase [Saprospiraceae bacterium]
MKNSLIAQIETQTGKTLTRLERLEGNSVVLRYEHNHSYICDEAGNLLSLYVREEEGLSNLLFPAEVCTSLQYLTLSENKNLNQINFEGPLPNLRYANLSECALTVITIPGGCFSLRKLYLNKNKLSKVHFEEGCPALELFDASQNQLETLELLPGFDKLAYLFLVDNKLRTLQFPKILPSLETLHLRGNQLTNFSEDILTSSPVLQSLFLGENPLPDAMRGTLDTINNGKSTLFLERYFKDLEKGGTPDNECKVLLIGNGNVGKSCLVHRLVNNKFLEKWESTHAISLSQYQLNEYLLNLWDFAGQDIYHATHRLFMQSEAIYLALWDCETEEKLYTPYHPTAKKGNTPTTNCLIGLTMPGSSVKAAPLLYYRPKGGNTAKKTCP